MLHRLDDTWCSMPQEDLKIATSRWPRTRCYWFIHSSPDITRPAVTEHSSLWLYIEGKNGGKHVCCPEAVLCNRGLKYIQASPWTLSLHTHTYPKSILNEFYIHSYTVNLEANSIVLQSCPVIEIAIKIGLGGINLKQKHQPWI